ncbi:MAG: hypothetical protein GX558_05550 [Clostridiales bacterium]|nr:hypothetical protein [Clostridiales bacterium]
MTAGEARAAARDWVLYRGTSLPGYAGAYFAGSAIELADGDALPPTSDLDLMLAFDGPAPPKPGKFSHLGATLDVGTIHAAALLPAERALAVHYTAYALHKDTVLDDPGGWLTPLQRAVAARYADEAWVRARVEAVLASIRGGIAGWRSGAPIQDQAICWAFSTGRTAHVALAAALENCTVRTRYEKARVALDRLGLGASYPTLLDLLGGQAMDDRGLARHLDELARTFDLAAALDASGFPFAGDVAVAARPAAIGEADRTLRGPWPREAIFWMAVTFARCHQVLADRAPALHAERLPALLRFLEALGIGRPQDVGRRLRSLEAALPEVARVADAAIAAHPGIRRGRHPL